MQKVDRETYGRVKAAIPEHPRRIVEERKPKSIYYVKQQVFDQDGRLVAMHDVTGEYYADESQLS